MKLGKNGMPLFPRMLTDVWSSFIDDYAKIHEQRHKEHRERFDCPWTTAPKNIDEFIEVCDARSKWEKENNASPPLTWSCTISHSLFEDIAREVKELRDAKRNS
jgi:hypothetical protein